jgi:hypothetical protein
MTVLCCQGPWRVHLWGKVHQGPAFCWLCCFLPRLGGPWKVHLSTHLECVGRRVHHAATYYIWRRGPCGTNPHVVGGGALPPWEPVSSGGGRLSGLFVGWWFFGLGGFSLAGFSFGVDEMSTPWVHDTVVTQGICSCGTRFG